jgi:4-carboxymuconolactone decarboxylase
VTTDALRLRPEQLTAEQRALYDAIVAGPRASGPFALTDAEGVLTGPFNAMLLLPALGTALQELGQALRYRGTLDDRCREIAILTVARVWDSKFERYAHEAVGARIGLTPQELAALRTGDLDAFSGTEREVVHYVSMFADDRRLDEADRQRALGTFGAERLFELTTLVGYYATLALQLKVFGDEVPKRQATTS